MPKTGSSILHRDGSLKEFRIELVESSGPVSPKYHYSTRIIFYSSGNSARIDYSDVRKYLKGRPAQPVKFIRDIDAADAGKIVRKIQRLDFVKSNSSADFIGSARSRTGISFNRLTVAIGPDTDLSVDYLLEDYERDEFAGFDKAIDIVKKLARFS